MTSVDTVHQKGSIVAWIALVVAVAALGLSWMNYNRTSNERLEVLLREQANETIDRMEQMIVERRFTGTDSSSELSTTTEE